MRRIFLLDLKKGFSGAGFYIGILLIVAAGILGMGEMLEYVTETVWPEGEIPFIGATYIALGSEALAYVMPIACTLAASGAYVEEQESGALYYVILRTTKRRYRISKMAGAAVMGMLTVLAAVLLMLAVFGIWLTPEMSQLQGNLLRNLGYLGEKVLILCLNASFFSMLGGMIGAGVNNRYMAYASPFILYYVISTLFKAYLSDYPLLNPEEWMLMRISGEGQAALILIAANVIAAAGYLLVMERRWKHE